MPPSPAPEVAELSTSNMQVPFAVEPVSLVVPPGLLLLLVWPKTRLSPSLASARLARTPPRRTGRDPIGPHGRARSAVRARLTALVK